MLHSRLQAAAASELHHAGPSTADTNAALPLAAAAQAAAGAAAAGGAGEGAGGVSSRRHDAAHGCAGADVQGGGAERSGQPEHPRAAGLQQLELDDTQWEGGGTGGEVGGRGSALYEVWFGGVTRQWPQVLGTSF